jgi:hypothetical protein
MGVGKHMAETDRRFGHGSRVSGKADDASDHGGGKTA